MFKQLSNKAKHKYNIQKQTYKLYCHYCMKRIDSLIPAYHNICGSCLVEKENKELEYSDYLIAKLESV